MEWELQINILNSIVLWQHKHTQKTYKSTWSFMESSHCVAGLWYTKHSVNTRPYMVTVTMTAWQQIPAVLLRHGTVVLFNIWLSMSTACFYHIILSHQGFSAHCLTSLLVLNEAWLLLCFGPITWQQQHYFFKTICPVCRAHCVNPRSAQILGLFTFDEFYFENLNHTILSFMK